MANNQILAISYPACRLNKELQSPQTVLLRTTLTRMIIIYVLMNTELLEVTTGNQMKKRCFWSESATGSRSSVDWTFARFYILSAKIVFGRDTILHGKDLLKTTTTTQTVRTACSVDASVQVWLLYTISKSNLSTNTLSTLQIILMVIHLS